MDLIVSQYSEDSARDNTDQKVYRVIHELVFPRMNSVSMTFGVTMNDNVSTAGYAWETFFLATSLLQTQLSSRPAPPNLDSLSIEKLPSAHQIDHSDNISKYLRNLRRLKIDTTTLTLKTGTDNPDDTQTYRGAVDFYARFPQVFLAPASHSLRVLHLSADARWGWYPKIELRGIHFPYLESLTLSRFTFSNLWQTQWLSHHADTLKSLSLINCAILCHATSTSEYIDREGYVYDSAHFRKRNPGRYSFWHKKRWSDYFFEFTCFLPRLQSFSLVAPGFVTRDAHRQSVPDEEEQACRVPDRYLNYTSVCFTPTCVGSGEEDKTTEQDEDDRTALWVLLEVIRRRKLPRDFDIPSIEPSSEQVPDLLSEALVRMIVDDTK